jgi:hypothetical protein
LGARCPCNVSSARRALSSRSGSAHRTRPRGKRVLVLRMACATHLHTRHWGGWPAGLNPPSHPLTHAVGSDRVDDIRGRRAPCHARVEIATHYRKRSRARATIHQRGQGCSSPVRLFSPGSPAHSIIRTAIHYRKRSRTRATVPQHWSQAPDPLPGVPSGQHPDRHPLPQAVEG